MYQALLRKIRSLTTFVFLFKLKTPKREKRTFSELVSYYVVPSQRSYLSQKQFHRGWQRCGRMGMGVPVIDIPLSWAIQPNKRRGTEANSPRKRKLRKDSLLRYRDRVKVNETPRACPLCPLPPFALFLPLLSYVQSACSLGQYRFICRLFVFESTHPVAIVRVSFFPPRVFMRGTAPASIQLLFGAASRSVPPAPRPPVHRALSPSLCTKGFGKVSRFWPLLSRIQLLFRFTLDLTVSRTSWFFRVFFPRIFGCTDLGYTKIRVWRREDLERSKCIQRNRETVVRRFWDVVVL